LDFKASGNSLPGSLPLRAAAAARTISRIRIEKQFFDTPAYPCWISFHIYSARVEFLALK
jgi:hypothetical protein